MTIQLNPQEYYRLPWSLSDNGISWLEVTTGCNLACEGCYRPNSGRHKTPEEVAQDLAVFARERRSDCMSIAGGDPLVHPELAEIVRMVKRGGWKPVVNTNGLALTPKLLRALVEAGVFGFTFHIDTSQKRRDSRAKTEAEHNRLRQKLAEMVAEVGGVACAFNQTVTSDTLDQVPDVVRWARQHPDIVNTVVFILYREPRLFGDFDYHAHGEKVPVEATYEEADGWGGSRLIKAADVVARIREVEPSYTPSAYLNGTEDATSTKWLIATRIGDAEETFGYVTPRFMEVVQQGYRALNGRWLSYSDPRLLAAGRASAMAFGLIDAGMRAIAGKIVRASLRKPKKLLEPAYLQTFTIIQPIDVLPDGRMNMCDGCPDMTVHEGKMYWSCRLEEIKQFGCFVTATPRRATGGERSAEQPIGESASG